MKFGILEARGPLRLYDANNSNYVGINPSATIAADFDLFLPNALPGATRFLSVDTGGNMDYATAVTSVDLSMPSIFSVAGSPVTEAGTITVTLDDAPANQVFAGPATGPDATPTFRGLVVADFLTLPTLDQWGPAAGPVDLNSNVINNLADPVADQDAATKSYVDALVQGLDVKDSSRYATTVDIANILTANQATVEAALDTVGAAAPTLQIGDRVLVRSQTTASENGIYEWDGANLSRTPDADETTEFGPGSFTFVEEGDNLADSGWVVTADSPFVLGTDDLTLAQFSGAGAIQAGDGLVKTGNTINIVTADPTRIVVNANDIDLAVTGVAAGTYNGLTVDAYGRVTSVTPTNFAEVYTQTFVDADLTAGAITINHNLGNQFPVDVIADSTGCRLFPDNITYVDANNLQIDLTSYGTIAGTYTVTLYA